MIAMSFRIAGLSRRLAADTDGAVAIIVALSLPVILGFGALALEYGTALITRAENQRTSDIAAYAAAYAYDRDTTGNPANTATIVAKQMAVLNGVPSDSVDESVVVTFDDPANAKTIDVTISEDKPIYLSRLLRPGDSVTINTFSRIALAQGSGPACILALDEEASEGIRVNGNPAGDYNFDGCNIKANAEIVVNGSGALGASCSAPNFNRSNACDPQTIKDAPAKDPYADFTDWPNDTSDNAVCDHIGTFPDDFFETGNTLKPGILCVTGMSKGNFGTVKSDAHGVGNTLILEKGVDFEMKGNPNLSIKSPDSGDFAGVSIYAPKSKVVIRGNPDLLNDGYCRSLVAGSWEFAGSVTVDLSCNKNDPLVEAGGSGNGPVLIQ